MITLTAADARRRMIGHLGLARSLGRGNAGIRKVLERLRCIQLDPLDVIGTNADLVILARVEGVGRGEVWKGLFPRHAFEHFAKERCILPASAFPRYRKRGHEAQAPWWRHDVREARVPPDLIAAVLEEIAQRGPITARDLADHGSVEPIDWSGWKGTARATTMALEILWTRCEIVVCGRTESGAKLYDLPERALGAAGTAAVHDDFERWALRERVMAAGLLSRAGGSHWSMLSSLRTSALPDEMIAGGELVEVSIHGSARRYLAVPGFLERSRVTFDERVRILGPLDPLLWDRDLVRLIFDFDYVWEVYKPESERRWGWYVCPLLHRDRLVGRVDARIEDERLVVRKLWLDPGFELAPVRLALERHAEACGCSRVAMAKRAVVRG